MMRHADPSETQIVRRRVAPLLREWLLVLTMMSVALLLLITSGALARLDQAIYDLTVRWSAPPAPESVLIVTIDDASLESLGPWPWDAARHAQAIDRLVAAGAQAISYAVTLERGSSDAPLVAAIRRARSQGVRVAMPVRIRVPGPDGKAYLAEPPPAGAIPGHNLIRTDGDGVVRQVDMIIDGSARWPHLAVAVTGAESGKDAALVGVPPFRARDGNDRLRAEAERLIGFRGPPGQFRSLPIMAVLAGEAPRQMIAGRTVLVGITAGGLSDRFATAVSGRAGGMSAVEIQASVVADLLQGRRLERAGTARSLTLALVMLWLVMVGMLILRPGLAGVFGIALLILVLMSAAAGLIAIGRWVGPGGAVVALLMAPPLWAWRRLAVVNDWMTRELTALGDLGLPKRLSRAPTDPVTRATEMLAATIDRVSELRRLADAALRGLPDATVLVGNTGQVVASNGAAEALFGADPSLESIDAAFAGAGLPAFGSAALAAADSPWRGEFRARDGSVREIRYTPWRNAGGAAMGWIVRFADISALRKAEAAREEALQLLTHDMRAPQASILALVDRAEGMPGETANRLRQLARRTIGLADGYLHLARAEAGNYAMGDVDLAAIATEAVDEMWPQAQAMGVRIDGLGLDDEALMWGNHSLLMRAIVNLISNALKHAPRGSTITVRLRGDRSDWRLDVEDRGPGVPAMLQVQLFGRFRTGGEGGGVGLGLAFVRSVAEGHGGLARCQSVPGDGATFTLWLPGIAAGRVMAAE
ncbi:CHASE2 domain-containing protein [Polymorphobacter sp.]|uniref:CHASE2 domain-containing protein n=1 Tax=Polymorphobacter sp. TaxID=1909290 RepID=UPI003F6EF745